MEIRRNFYLAAMAKKNSCSFYFWVAVMILGLVTSYKVSTGHVTERMMSMGESNLRSKSILP